METHYNKSFHLVTTLLLYIINFYARIADSSPSSLYRPDLFRYLRWVRDCAEPPTALDLDELGADCALDACSGPAALE